MQKDTLLLHLEELRCQRYYAVTTTLLIIYRFFFLNNKEAGNVYFLILWRRMPEHYIHLSQPNYTVSITLMAAKQACAPVTHHVQCYLMGETDFKVRHNTCKNRKFKNQSHHRHFHCHLLCEINKAADNFYFAVALLRYAIKSALSDFFLIPAKIIFVPGIYFFGFSKYSIRVSSPQVIPREK